MVIPVFSQTLAGDGQGELLTSSLLFSPEILQQTLIQEVYHKRAGPRRRALSQAS